MGRPSRQYEPRQPGERVLYHVVRDHLETFLVQTGALRDGLGVPRFVEREFRDFLRCGWLAGGFARFHCGGCGLDRLVPFSCKGRGFCPSCGGRRMAERAAHLVDRVFPEVPVRQWVVSLPLRVRYAVAWDHGLCRAVVGVALRAILGSLRTRARRQGVAGGRGGAVAIVQRFGSALNLNVHVHALVLDGVYTSESSGALTFHAADTPTEWDLEGVVSTLERRIARLLARRGLTGSDEAEPADPWGDEAPVLAGLAAASVQGRVALGPRAGAALRRIGNPEIYRVSVVDPAHARCNGFDVHAGLVVPAGDRVRLERVCRYALRPPIAEDRLRLTAEGHVQLQLRRRWSDGTSHLLFDPVELLERLAAITPRPRVNLILYYGVLGARATWRKQVVRRGGDTRRDEGTDEASAQAPGAAVSGGRHLWADLMRRSFGFDVLACPRCGGRLRLVALIEEARVIERILRHLGLPAEVPATHPARAPPFWAEVDRVQNDDAALPADTRS